MKCPACNFPKDKVIDSRLCKDGQAIRRRRECLQCHRRYTTYEYIESALMVIKKDGRREAFDRQKLLSGIRKAVEKRPIGIDAMEKMVESIENELQTGGHNEVSADIIGELVMKHLQGLDGVAYVRFASVYRRFEDASDFVKEVKGLSDE